MEIIKNLFKKDKMVKSEKKPFEYRYRELFDNLQVDVLCIKIGNDLVDFGDEICNSIWQLREDLTNKYGYIIPAVRILDCKDIQENEYIIEVRGEIVKDGFTVPQKTYATKELTDELEHVCFEYINQIFTTELVEKYVDIVNDKNSLLMYNVNRVVPITAIKQVLVDLLKAKKSIKDIVFVFEKICESAMKDRDMCTYRNSKVLSSEVFDAIH